LPKPAKPAATATATATATAAAALLGSAALFAALGDETRLRLVARLCDDGPMSISRLTNEAGADVSRQAITKHLRLMHDAGLVRETRRGRESVWQLEPRRLEEARIHLDEISRQWDEALLRLQSFVESPE
jgi:DNA-binding transcriptional ArsR family regulator